MRMMRAVVLAAACGLAAGERAAEARQQAADAAPAWKDPVDHDARMAWWREARFGMFIHWGLYSVAAGEWNGYKTGGVGEWLQRSGNVPVHEYEKLTREFNPVKFDAKEWVRIAKDAGCRYIVITSKHHDGFCLFKTGTTWYNAVDATPWKRDALRELADACRDEGVKLCFYYSIWDWHNPDFKGSDAGKDRMPMYIGFMKAQLRELLTNYGDIGVLWFDGEWPDEWTEERGRELYEFCRGLQPNIIINNRVGKARDDMAGISKYKGAGDYDTPEQEIPVRGLPGVDWETCMTMNRTWGFKKNDHDWKSEKELVRMLCETASKGGNFLLNVGPTGEGEIPKESVERMAAVGRWLRVNAEAVYGSAAGPFERRQPWGTVSMKREKDADVLYLHVVDVPGDSVLRIRGLRGDVRLATVLGEEGVLEVVESGEGTEVRLPGSIAGRMVPVVRLVMTPGWEVRSVPVRQNEGGGFVLAAAEAELHGRGLKLEQKDGGVWNIGFWTDPKARAEWTVLVEKPGTYAVNVELSCEDAEAGDVYEVVIGDAVLPARTIKTGTWVRFVEAAAGVVTLREGEVRVTVRAGEGLKGALMNVRSLKLTPVR